MILKYLCVSLLSFMCYQCRTLNLLCWIRRQSLVHPIAPAIALPSGAGTGGLDAQRSESLKYLSNAKLTQFHENVFLSWGSRGCKIHQKLSSCHNPKNLSRFSTSKGCFNVSGYFEYLEKCAEKRVKWPFARLFLIFLYLNLLRLKQPRRHLPH